MGLERGAEVEKLDGAWSARFCFRPGGDQGTIDRCVERRCKNREERGALETRTGPTAPLELKRRSSGG